MVYEPGPFAIRTAMPLAPPIARPGLFLGDVAAIGGSIAGLEQGWGASVATIAPLADRTLDPDYNANVVPAFTGLDLFDTPAENAAFARLAGAADQALSDVDRQLLDLPNAGETEPGTDEPKTPDPGDLPGRD